MFTALIGFLFGLAVATSVTEGRRIKPPISRYLALTAAIVMTVVFFGYTLGKDMAIRDNADGCRARAAAVGSAVPPLKAADSLVN